ncbi:MAG: hypothetical protein NWQ32_10580 [Paracoccaceae bacterium]|nr:hypothetical protein [Paracoccaceae bacterium]
MIATTRGLRDHFCLIMGDFPPNPDQAPLGWKESFGYNVVRQKCCMQSRGIE